MLKILIQQCFLFLSAGMFLSLFAGCENINMKCHKKVIPGIGIVDWVSLNHDGSLIAFGNGKKLNGILLYETASGKEHVIWDSKTWDSEAFAQSAAFHPTNSDYIACCDQVSVGLVNWRTGETLFRLELPHGFMPGIEFSSDGTKIFVIHSFFGEGELPPN